jgi:TctA family transporter
MDLIATALPALGEAMVLILRPEQMMFLFLGVVLGLSVGVLPGLGGIAGLSLVLPFIFGMDPVSGLALMVGLIAVVPTSDTFASVLLGIPGSTASQATVLDGFPLSKKGEAARALSAAFASSLFGGLLGAAVLTFFILFARPLILAFGLPEMLMITVLGLSMVAILAGRIPLKGVVAAGLGLMVGTIGEAAAGGSLRMSTYEIPYLIGGLGNAWVRAAAPRVTWTYTMALPLASPFRRSNSRQTPCIPSTSGRAIRTSRRLYCSRSRCSRGRNSRPS